MTGRDLKARIQLARCCDRAERTLEKLEQAKKNLEEMIVKGADSQWAIQRYEEIKDRQLLANFHLEKTKDARRDVERFFDEIEDQYIYVILTRKYVDGYSWQQVAAHAGGGNTAESVRKMAARYLHRRTFEELC
ncbi:MAG: hypothetical protein IKY33_04060 [Clostridia bacterium]|nr:hypothetical protein [Clostridia bacterium]